MTDQEKELTDEPEASRGELEGLKKEREALTRELESRGATIAGLQQAQVNRDSEIVALKQVVSEAENKLANLSDALAQAVASYKDMVVKTNPGVLAELITGDTVDEVNESLKNAQALVDRVRQEMEAEAAKTKVPAGAPQRAPLDLSALSPREKIQYGIGGKR
ncbi:hypothetical protein ACFLUZ_04745 [Chloroflexota bacterium]